MSKYLLMLALAVLLPAEAIRAQVPPAAIRAQEITSILALIERARVDQAAAQTIIVGAHEAAERIARDPASRDSLPLELDMYFDRYPEIIAGEFGEVPDATRAMLVEALTELAIAYPDRFSPQDALTEAGRVGFARVDEALFRVYTGQRERGYQWASIIIDSYQHLPSDQALPYLAHLTAQQDDNVAAIAAFMMLLKFGREGGDAIMALEHAGTVNDFVWQSVRMGTQKVDEICPLIPDFTPCVQNAILGNPQGAMLQVTCDDLPRLRGAFPPEEYAGLVRRLCRLDS